MAEAQPEVQAEAQYPGVGLNALADIESPDYGLREYAIKVIENLGKIEVTDGQLFVSPLHGLMFNGSRRLRIPYQNVRWISLRKFMSINDDFDWLSVLVLSYEDPESQDISYIFFKCDEIDMDIIEEIHTLKLSTSDTAIYNKHGLHLMNILREQPKEIAPISVKVTTKQSHVTDDDTSPKKCMMILDLECMSFFEGPTEKPSHHIKFWAEEGENVVETVKVLHTENEIQLESSKYIFSFTKNWDIEQRLKEMFARPKKFFTDIQNLVSVKSKPFVRPETFPMVGPPQTQRQRPEATQDFVPIPGPLKIDREMDEALAAIGAEETFQIQWITIEADLNEIMQTGALDETEIQSGGLNPDSVDHFERALTDAADHITEQRLTMALSRMQAARNFFAASNNYYIRRVFEADNIELLRKLYFRSLIY